MRAPFGWSIVRRGGYKPYHHYMRDCPPPPNTQLADDTFPTEREAKQEAERRNFDLKQQF